MRGKRLSLTTAIAAVSLFSMAEHSPAFSGENLEELKDAIAQLHTASGSGKRKDAIKLIQSNIGIRSETSSEKLDLLASEALPLLKAALSDKDKQVRRKSLEVVRALGKRATPVVQEIAAALKDRERNIRDLSFAILQELLTQTSLPDDSPDHFVDVLETVIVSGHPVLCSAALTRLREIDPKTDFGARVIARAIPIAAIPVNDRIQAIRSIAGHFPLPPEAGALLVEALNTPPPDCMAKIDWTSNTSLMDLATNAHKSYAPLEALHTLFLHGHLFAGSRKAFESLLVSDERRQILGLVALGLLGLDAEDALPVIKPLLNSSLAHIRILAALCASHAGDSSIETQQVLSQFLAGPPESENLLPRVILEALGVPYDQAMPGLLKQLEPWAQFLTGEKVVELKKCLQYSSKVATEGSALIGLLLTDVLDATTKESMLAWKKNLPGLIDESPFVPLQDDRRNDLLEFADEVLAFRLDGVLPKGFINDSWYRKDIVSPPLIAEDPRLLRIVTQIARWAGAEAFFTLPKLRELSAACATPNLKRNVDEAIREISKSHHERMRDLQRSAADGNAEAQVKLGLCYLLGEGAPRDLQIGVGWYQKAAEQGRADAQIQLGDSFLRGEGVDKDPSKAIEWFRKAAEQNASYAQRKLGDCYAEGVGVPKDIEQALIWYRKAAVHGDQESRDAVTRLEKK